MQRVDVLIERHNWFAKFRSGNFNLEHSARSGRPLEADVNKIKSLVDANRRITLERLQKAKICQKRSFTST